MMQRPRLLLLELVWEIFRLALVFGLAALVVNREVFLDSTLLLLLLGVPALIIPAAVLLLYLEPLSEGLRLLLTSAKILMILVEGSLALLLSIFGLILTRLFSFDISLQLPPSTGMIVLGLAVVDVLFLVHLLLFKPARSEQPRVGIPETPAVRIEEE